MDIYFERIKPLIDARRGEGASDAQMEREIGLPPHSINKWNSGKYKSFRSYIAHIARYFNVSVEYLMGEVDDPSPRRAFAAPNVTDEVVSFPVIGGVAAGYDHIAYEDWDGSSIDIPRSFLHGHPPTDYFVLRVKGNSMHPDYQDGDHVLVQRQSTMDRSGQVGAVIYGDENATLKRVDYVMGEDWMILRPINPQFPSIRIEGEELEHCHVLGVARYVIREVLT